ncbi:hypothetical protein [uncultured Paenibacillus sp.]|nr:hypothetical protein [uncultured Paenibacillus sp.]
MITVPQKLLKSRIMRKKLRDLYDDIIDSDKFGVDTREIEEKAVALSEELENLEYSIRKNRKYVGLEWRPPTGYKVSGTLIGHCQLCQKEIFSEQKIPDPTEEGLFCNYYCRRVFRNREDRRAQ